MTRDPLNALLLWRLQDWPDFFFAPAGAPFLGESRAE
jgi:hypothetical protein